VCSLCPDFAEEHDDEIVEPRPETKDETIARLIEEIDRLSREVYTQARRVDLMMDEKRRYQQTLADHLDQCHYAKTAIPIP
jgi:hypothetical protein